MRKRLKEKHHQQQQQ